jgi:hypothetical protein
MEKEFWRNSISKKKFLCPNCNVGLLSPVSDGFYSIRTKESIQLEIETRGQYPWTEFLCSGILKCNSCNEVVSTCGSWTEDRQGIELIENPKTGQLKLSEPDKYFYPKYFHPVLKFFPIPQETPVKINDCLIKSFALYWSDIPSALNKLRIAVEYLLDDMKISRLKIMNNGKRNRKPHRKEVRLSLEQRINLFKRGNHELGNYLINLKEVGNVASHSIEINDSTLLLNAFEIMEFVLISIYKKPSQNDLISAKA